MKQRNNYVKMTLIIIAIVALLDFIALLLWNDPNNRSDIPLEEIYHLMQNTKVIDICYPFPDENIKLKNPDNIETLCKEDSFIKRVDNPGEVKEYIEAFTSGIVQTRKITKNDLAGYYFYFLDDGNNEIVYVYGLNSYMIYAENTKYYLFSNNDFFKNINQDIFETIMANKIEK